MLQSRKERYFADDRRFILSYQLDVTRGQYHLSMISTEGDELETGAAEDPTGLTKPSDSD